MKRAYTFISLMENTLHKLTFFIFKYTMTCGNDNTQQVTCLRALDYRRKHDEIHPVLLLLDDSY